MIELRRLPTLLMLDLRHIVRMMTLATAVMGGGFTTRAAGEACQFLPGQRVGTIGASVINEASGLAASRRNPGVLWTHNDSGGANAVYAMTISGTLLGTYSFGSGSIWDTEDIAIGPGPTPGVDYIYWGDIGDNNNVRSSIVVKRAPEPFVDPNQSPVTVTLSGVVLITLKYPTGAHAPSEKDAETMFVDPLTRDIYVVTKRAVPNKVYRVPYPQSTTTTTTMAWVADLPPEFNGTPGSWNGGPTGGDMSPDGSLLVIRQYSWKTPAAAVWYRPAGSSVASVFAGQYCSGALQSDGAGEAIAWDAGGLGFYTTQDETTNAPICYYARIPGTVPPPMGDLNCDGAVNGLDVQAFVTALVDPTGYATKYAACDILLADLDSDGTVGISDVQPFSQALLHR
jgi:hypothetical protein